VTARTFGTAKLRSGVWHLDLVPHVALRAKRLFKRSDRGTAGRLKLSHTPEVAADLEWFASRYPIDFDPPEALRQSAAAHRETILRLEDYMRGDYVPREFAMKFPPRTYQAREASIVLDQGYLLSADEVGLGKTVTGIAVLSDPRALPAVVVCPTHLPRQWAEEIRRFLPEARIHVCKKATPYPIETGLFGLPDVVVVTYSKLAGWSTVLSKFAKTVIFDEIQALRSGSGTQRYSGAEELAGACSYRLGLSATPIYNYGGEIFNVFEILKPGILGTWPEFLVEWCSQAGSNGYKIRDPKAFGTWAREQFAMVRHTRADVGRELPDVLKISQTVETDPEPLKAIEDRSADLARVILGTGESRRGQKMEAAEELSNTLRQATGIAKAPYVAEFVRMLVENGEKVVVCGWHRKVYEIWRTKLADLGVVLYTGSETATQKDESKRAFVKGDANVLLLSLRSGEGLNDLQLASSCIVFGELDWSPGVHEQAIGRLQRDGQTNKVVAYYLVAEEGSDPTVSEVLGMKRAQVDGIRDPYGSLIESLDTSGDRVRELAEAYLKRKGLPRAAPVPRTAIDSFAQSEEAIA
jgi:SNF2 family DNA or RNA helicase